jgi:hypothetical protein
MPAVYKFRTWILLFKCLPNHFISSTQTVIKTLNGLFAFILGIVLSLLPILPAVAAAVAAVVVVVVVAKLPVKT